MGNRQYPVVGPWTLIPTKQRPYSLECDCHVCGQKITGDKCLVREIEVSWFRGEDEVYFAHPACIPKKER